MSWSRLPAAATTRCSGVYLAKVVLVDLLPADRVDRVRGAQDRPAQRGVTEQLRGERLVHGVRGIVVVHRDLFEHHVALGVHVLRRDQRAGHHVGQDVHGQRQVHVEHPRVIAGVLLGGERVHLAADRVHLRGDVQRGTPLGALEQQVLQVVGRARVRRGPRRGSRRPPRCRGATERTAGRNSVTTRSPPGRTVRLTPRGGSVATSRACPRVRCRVRRWPSPSPPPRSPFRSPVAGLAGTVAAG